MNIFYILFLFYYCQQVLFTLRVSSLLSPLNDASGDIAVDKGSFQFSHDTEFISPLQQTPKQNHHVQLNCYSIKNMLKPLAFKWLFNELLLETEWSEVMLIWWFFSIKFIRSFSKFSFLNLLFQAIPLVASTSLEKLSLFYLQISFW